MDLLFLLRYLFLMKFVIKIKKPPQEATLAIIDAFFVVVP